MKDSAVKRKIGVGLHDSSGTIDPNQKTRYKKPKPSSSGSALQFPLYLPSALSITRVLSTEHVDDARYGTGEGHARQNQPRQAGCRELSAAPRRHCTPAEARCEAARREASRGVRREHVAIIIVTPQREELASLMVMRSKASHSAASSVLSCTAPKFLGSLRPHC
jgi:hypothetical protein